MEDGDAYSMLERGTANMPHYFTIDFFRLALFLSGVSFEICSHPAVGNRKKGKEETRKCSFIKYVQLVNSKWYHWARIRSVLSQKA